MKFSDMVGDGKFHSFFGVDNNTFKLGRWIFEAIEDENDGYRSMLGTVEQKDCKEIQYCIFFGRPICQVRVKEAFDIEGYELEDADGWVWLRIGTDQSDEYYPWFVFEYKPKEPKRPTTGD